MNVHGLYVLWEARRNYFPHFPERTLKLGEDVSVETTSSPQGQGFATEVCITQALPPQRGTGNGEFQKNSPILKNTPNKAL